MSESLHYHWSRGLDLAGNKFVDFDATHKGSLYTFACPLWIIGIKFVDAPPIFFHIIVCHFTEKLLHLKQVEDVSRRVAEFC